MEFLRMKAKWTNGGSFNLIQIFPVHQRPGRGILCPPLPRPSSPPTRSQLPANKILGNKIYRKSLAIPNNNLKMPLKCEDSLLSIELGPDRGYCQSQRQVPELDVNERNRVPIYNIFWRTILSVFTLVMNTIANNFNFWRLTLILTGETFRSES